ncbi:phosphoenolpyruvate-protein phosphotransferase [Pseudolysinimonas yzui]|uniref:Phosphoenolpyruvate-protein phosphotransferase n=1 Tax=Pseudolysinimonas yzui TaxID=2708254 RepID=A0A8J3M1W8_9MICO|nr:phosphoenolpyruvate-protein phosphotransferase [Pseudolysinimonas yzui]
MLEAQALMLDDPMLKTDVDSRIDTGTTAERAVHEAFGVFRDMLAAMGEYMAARVADLDDLSRRAVARLSGVPAPGIPQSDTPFVLVARDLAPADTALLDPALVLAIVTSDGGKTSHTAILAGEKGLPAVVGTTGALEIAEGAMVIVDAGAGLVEVDPSPDALAAAEQKVADRAARVHVTGPGALADGTAIPLLANLGSADGVEAAVAAGAEGVGLFRTEFLFLDATSAPAVDAQQAAYSAVLRGFPGKKVVVRVLDAGADKPLQFLNAAKEENPALGLRGIRALRVSEPILRDQLTALARADAETDAEVWVMAPMVATVDETRYFTALSKELGLKTAGVMVEVPAAALLADRILNVTDFASIGTNDLTQYTMAADRMLGSVSDFQDPWHPAVLRLVGEIGAAGTSLGKPVGVCGEAAADPKLAVVLVGLGVTSLSMSAPAIAEVRDELARWSPQGTRDAADLALDAEDAASARAAVEALTPY